MGEKLHKYSSWQHWAWQRGWCSRLEAKKGKLTDQEHIRIWDLDLSNHELENFDLSRCKLLRVKFVGASLIRSNFEQTIMRECNFTRSKLVGTSFRGADLKTSIFRNVQIDDETDLSIAKGRLPNDADLMLEDRVKAVWAREEFDQDPSRGKAHRALVKLLDYGDNLWRLFIAASIVIVAFALLFKAAAPPTTSWLKVLIYSLQYFVALSDPWAESYFALSVVGTFEACIGLIFLALLLSSITKQLVLAR